MQKAWEALSSEAIRNSFNVFRIDDEPVSSTQSQISRNDSSVIMDQDFELQDDDLPSDCSIILDEEEEEDQELEPSLAKQVITEEEIEESIREPLI